MLLTVEQVCDENESVWSGVAACAAAVTALKGITTAIADARQIQENSHTGVTQDKQVKRENMAAMAVIVKGAIQALATDTQNNELYKSVNYSLSSIMQQPNTVSRDRALLIYNKAASVSPQLTDYGIDSAMLDNFHARIADFSGIMSMPRIAISTVKASTTEIGRLFADADLILRRKLDKLMIQFKMSNPAFYNTYLNARQIIDLGKGSRTLTIILQPGESRTIQRVIDGSALHNSGTTALRYCADQLTPCDATAAGQLLLAAGESLDVRLQEACITVTNADALKRGRFKVRVTSTAPVASEEY